MNFWQIIDKFKLEWNNLEINTSVNIDNCFKDLINYNNFFEKTINKLKIDNLNNHEFIFEFIKYFINLFNQFKSLLYCIQNGKVFDINNFDFKQFLKIKEILINKDNKEVINKIIDHLNNFDFKDFKNILNKIDFNAYNNKILNKNFEKNKIHNIIKDFNLLFNFEDYSLLDKNIKKKFENKIQENFFSLNKKLIESLCFNKHLENSLIQNNEILNLRLKEIKDIEIKQSISYIDDINNEICLNFEKIKSNDILISNPNYFNNNKTNKLKNYEIVQAFNYIDNINKEICLNFENRKINKQLELNLNHYNNYKTNKLKNYEIIQAFNYIDNINNEICINIKEKKINNILLSQENFTNNMIIKKNEESNLNRFNNNKISMPYINGFLKKNSKNYLFNQYKNIKDDIDIKNKLLDNYINLNLKKINSTVLNRINIEKINNIENEIRIFKINNELKNEKKLNFLINELNLFENNDNINNIKVLQNIIDILKKSLNSINTNDKNNINNLLNVLINILFEKTIFLNKNINLLKFDSGKDQIICIFEDLLKNINSKINLKLELNRINLLFKHVNGDNNLKLFNNIIYNLKNITNNIKSYPNNDDLEILIQKCNNIINKNPNQDLILTKESIEDELNNQINLNNTLNGSFKNLKLEISDLNITLNNKQFEYENLKTKLDKELDYKQHLIKIKDDLLGKINLMKNEISILNTNLDDIDNINNKEKFKKLELERDSLKEQIIKKNKGDVLHLRKIESEIKSLNEKLIFGNDDLKEYINKKNEKIKILNKMTLDLKNLKTEIQNYKQDINIIESDINTNDQKIIKNQNKIHLLKENWLNLKNQKEIILSKKQEIETDIEFLLKKLQNKEEILNNERLKINNSNKKISIISQAIQGIDLEISNSISNYHNDNLELKFKLKQKDSQINDLNSKLNNLNSLNSNIYSNNINDNISINSNKNKEELYYLLKEYVLEKEMNFQNLISILINSFYKNNFNKDFNNIKYDLKYLKERFKLLYSSLLVANSDDYIENFKDLKEIIFKENKRIYDKIKNIDLN